MGRALRAPGELRSPPAPKYLGPCSRSPAPSPRPAPPPARHTASGSCLPASWGLILTQGRPPRGPSQGAWHRNAGDWGPPSPSAGLTLRPTATRAVIGAAGHSGQENVQGTPSPWRLSKAPCAKTLVPTLPLLNARSSACPSARCTSSRWGLPASWGLTLTLVGLLRGPSQGVWRPNVGDW